MDFAVPAIEEEHAKAAASGAHIVEQTVALFEPQIKVGHRMGNAGRDSEEESLETALARAREEEDKFLQAVPQDETMKGLSSLRNYAE